MQRSLLTGEVGVLLTQELGLAEPLTERRINSLIRAWPPDRRPRVIGGKRRWAAADVDQLREALEARRGEALSTT